MNGSAEKIALMRKAYIEQAFIIPADQNYIISRIALNRNLIIDGYWAAAQAVEKYLKASLLSNGSDALASHDLIGLFDKLKLDVPLAIIPDDFVKPTTPEPPHGMVFDWGNNSIRQFVSHLDIYGSSDNRYGRNGYHFDSFILHKLDQLIYLLRRNCRTLNTDITAHNDLSNWKLGSTLPLETHIEKKSWATDMDNQLVDDFLTNNSVWQSMLGGGAVQVRIQPIISWRQSAYYVANSHADNSRQDKIEFNEWLLSHVKLSRHDKSSIKNIITQLKAEHP